MPVGGFSGTTLNDLVEKTYWSLMSNQSEVVAKLGSSYTTGAGTLSLTNPFINTITVGSKLACSTTDFRVDAWTPNGNNSGGTAAVTVVDGSTDQNLSANADVFINPKYTRWQIAVAINEALAILSSPTNGLYQVGETTITYNPVYSGYDLGAVPANFTAVLELTADHPYPDRNFIRVRRYDVVRGVTSAKFPSGRGLILKEFKYTFPGFNLNMAYGYPFTPLQALTDDVVTTGGLPSTAIDLPPLLAEALLTEGREIKRNFIENQPDPRKALDVPPGAVLASTNKLDVRIERRISEERDRLDNIWPHQRRF